MHDHTHIMTSFTDALELSATQPKVWFDLKQQLLNADCESKLDFLSHSITPLTDNDKDHDNNGSNDDNHGNDNNYNDHDNDHDCGNNINNDDNDNNYNDRDNNGDNGNNHDGGNSINDNDNSINDQDEEEPGERKLFLRASCSPNWLIPY